MTDRLPDLLARRAQQGSAVHPTMDGVQAAVERRATHRRRRRAVGSGVAALCLVAGVVGGFALSRGDDGATPITPVDIPDLPLIGIERDGFVLANTDVSPLFDQGDDSGDPVTFVTFRSDGSLAGPLISVAVDSTFGGSTPVDADARPVDLDGDGTDDAEVTSTPSGGVGVSWPDGDRTVGVGGYGLAESDVVAYAATVFEDSDPLAAPAPDGLPDRTTVTMPSGLDSEATRAVYRNGNRKLRVSVTNEPNYADVLELYATSTYEGFEDADVGDAFFGPAEGVVSEPRPGYGYAIIRTESGLTIDISTDGGPTSADELRDLLAAGSFVELDPTTGPTTTTEVATASTLPTATTDSIAQTTTSIVDPSSAPSLVDYRRVDLDNGREAIELEFDGEPVDVTGGGTGTRPMGGCDQYAAAFRDLWAQNGNPPIASWGVLFFGNQRIPAMIDGPVLHPDDPSKGFIACTTGHQFSIAMPLVGSQMQLAGTFTDGNVTGATFEPRPSDP